MRAVAKCASHHLQKGNMRPRVASKSKTEGRLVKIHCERRLCDLKQISTELARATVDNSPMFLLLNHLQIAIPWRCLWGLKSVTAKCQREKEK